MASILYAIIVPIFILNFLGGLISGIWLAILGDWWAIGIGVASLLSPFIIGVILLFSFLFSAPSLFFAEKRKYIFSIFFSFLNQIFLFSVMSAWSIFIFYILISKSDVKNLEPLLIWSYGVAMGPWIFLAKKDLQSGSGDASSISLFVMQIAYILTCLLFYFTSLPIFYLLSIFSSIMGVGVIIQTFMFSSLLKNSQSSW